MYGVRVCAVVFSVLVGASALQAQAATRENPWLIRARGVAVIPNASSDALNLDVTANATMEVDISRFINDYLSIELILATSGHEVKSGSTSIGAVNVLPPTLLLQVRPPTSGIQPYAGGGVNLTAFYGKYGALDALELSTSINWAAQVGVDVPIGSRGVFNLDGKYVKMGTDVKDAGGTQLAHLKINPLVIGAGFGYRF